MSHQQNRQPLFAQIDNGNAPKKLGETVGLGETYQRMGIPHPFSYVFLNQAKPSPIPKPNEKTHTFKSEYVVSRNELAVHPNDFLSLYYTYLKQVLMFISSKDERWFTGKYQDRKWFYDRLPSFDELYRKATEEKITDFVHQAYTDRYRSPSDNPPDLNEKYTITSLIETMLFLEEIVSLFVSRILQEFNYEQLKKQIENFLTGVDNHALRECLESWCKEVGFLPSEHVIFNSGNGPLDERLPEHLITSQIINQSMRLYLLRHVRGSKRQKAYIDYSENIITDSISRLIKGIDECDSVGIRAGIQEEVKYAHKSYYAPHELLFID